MSQPRLPDDVREFILKNIGSIAQIEGLLLLKNNPEMALGAGDVARRLYICEAEAAAVLAHLKTHGFLSEKESLYSYAPATTEIDRMTARMMDIYARSLLPVTQLIHSRSGHGVQAFADAFQIKKEGQIQKEGKDKDKEK
jgi:hypothetical protein